jgi:hypothetical protein
MSARAARASASVAVEVSGATGALLLSEGLKVREAQN